MRENARPDAIESLKETLVVQELAKVAGIEVSPEAVAEKEFREFYFGCSKKEVRYPYGLFWVMRNLTRERERRIEGQKIVIIFNYC